MERDLPAGVATSQTEVMMTEMNSDVLKYKYKLVIADAFRQRKEKKRHNLKKLATSFTSPQMAGMMMGLGKRAPNSISDGGGSRMINERYGFC